MTLKSKFRKILVYTAFLFFLGGCAQGGGGGSSDSGDSDSSILPRGDGTALISWTPPTQNTDGSALTDLAGYRILYGTSSGNYRATITLNGSGLTSYLVENLGASDWYFVMTAFNSSGIESGYSPEVFKAIN